RQRPRRAGPPHGARGGGRDRLAASSRDDGVGLRPPGLAVPARPLRRQDRGRTRAAADRRGAAAFNEDAHGGWWETSLMLMIRPDLVDQSYRTLPPARYSLPERAVPNFPLRSGGRGYVGHPALADPAFAKAASEVLMAETMDLVEGLLDGRIPPSVGRS